LTTISIKRFVSVPASAQKEREGGKKERGGEVQKRIVSLSPHHINSSSSEKMSPGAVLAAEMDETRMEKRKERKREKKRGERGFQTLLFPRHRDPGEERREERGEEGKEKETSHVVSLFAESEIDGRERRTGGKGKKKRKFFSCEKKKDVFSVSTRIGV